MRRFPVFLALCISARAAAAQTHADSLRGVAHFQLEYTGLVSSGPPRMGFYLGDRGAHASVEADEFGNLNVWVGPNKIVRDLQLAFRLAGPDSTYEQSAVVSTVVKRPEGLTFVYSHPAFTVREHVFVPLDEHGAIVLLDVETARPLDVLVRMSEDSRPHVVIGAPPSSGVPQILRFDPVTARQYIPIIIAGGGSPDSIAATYERLVSDPKRYWREKVAHYRELRMETVSMSTPDDRIDQAFEWAKAQLEHARAPDVMSMIAMNGTGQLDRVRETLVNPMVPATASWVLAAYEYWTASNDDFFLRDMWPNISTAFKRAASRDVDGDGLIEDPATDIHLAAVWVAALDGVQHMARAIKDAGTQARAAQLLAVAQSTLDSAFWNGIDQSYEASAARPHALTIAPATAMSFGLLDAERSGRMLRELSSSAITTDWGARALSRFDSLYDPLHAERGAVTPVASGFAAMAHYRHHRAWSGFDLLRDMARASLDFERGRTAEALSGAFYQQVDSSGTDTSRASAMFVWPLVRGMLGWQTDAPHRAAALEPHLPADWQSARVSGLRMGRDRIEATITRERGLYAVHLRRLTSGPALSIRVAPALPMGARIERIIVDDVDVSVQAEESVHDVHGVADVTLVRDAQIEFHYDGGMEMIAPKEPVEIGDASRNPRVLDFRRDGRDYVVTVEGNAGIAYTLELRTETRLRTAVGADAFDQADERATIRLTMPAGADVTRKTIRLRP